MEEIVNVDGRIYRLTSDRSLTVSETTKAITDIRSGKMTNLKVRALQNQVCTSINTVSSAVGPSIAITDITIGTIDCGTGPTCPGDFTCTNPMCTPADSVTVVVTYANSGDQDGTASPALSINGVNTGITPSEGATITISAGGLAIATFVGVTLDAGPNNVCASWS